MLMMIKNCIIYEIHLMLISTLNTSTFCIFTKQNIYSSVTEFLFKTSVRNAHRIIKGIISLF